MLSTFCGIEVKNPQKPTVAEVNATNNRPELRLFDAQLRLADAQEKALNSALMPKLGVFAQGYYGYPGLNMFEDMTRYEWSLNGIIGARLTWNIGAIYTRKNDKAKLQLQRDLTESNREVFLFNNNLEQIQQNEEIARYLGVMPSQAEEILTQAAAAGELEDVRLAGLRAKALEIVIAEANCTYEHETEQEANERVRASIQERAMMESFMQQQQQNNQSSAEDDHPHLKLV
jgi:hypothetical protein